MNEILLLSSLLLIVGCGKQLNKKTLIEIIGK